MLDDVLKAIVCSAHFTVNFICGGQLVNGSLVDGFHYDVTRRKHNDNHKAAWSCEATAQQMDFHIPQGSSRFARAEQSIYYMV